MAATRLVSMPYNVNDRLVCDSENKFEREFGYHRAVRKGPFIFVSGTTALQPDGRVAFPGDAKAQAQRAFQVGIDAIEALGGSREDVVRVRMFVAVSNFFCSIPNIHKLPDRLAFLIVFKTNSDTGAVGSAFRDTFKQPDTRAIDGAGFVTGTVATMIVSGKNSFVDSEMLVEVELDAVV